MQASGRPAKAWDKVLKEKTKDRAVNPVVCSNLRNSVRKRTGNSACLKWGREAESELTGFAIFLEDGVEHLRQGLSPRLDVESNIAR